VVAARTISIETGMQNSGLGAFLAKRHFPAEPLTAVPAAISALVHSVLGSLLAGWWRLRPAPSDGEDGRLPFSEG
jgi:BASS family bile acid:Na+ symporter